MTKDEDIASYILWVILVVNEIWGIGGKLDEDEVVKKVLRLLPRFIDLRFFLLRIARIWIDIHCISYMVLSMPLR